MVYITEILNVLLPLMICKQRTLMSWNKQGGCGVYCIVGLVVADLLLETDVVTVSGESNPKGNLHLGEHDIRAAQLHYLHPSYL